MKASPSTIIYHPNLSNSQKAIGLLAKFSESKTVSHDLRFERKRKGTCQAQWALESEINKFQATLPPLTTLDGSELLKALSFRGYSIFMRDPSGRVFPVYPHQEYQLNAGKVRVHSRKASQEYDPAADRIAYSLMFHDTHETVRGTKVLLLNVNTNFSTIYPTVVEL